MPDLLLDLEGTKPQRLVVFRPAGAPREGGTEEWGIMADYGWCERILFSNAYGWVARDIATALGDRLCIKVEAPEPVGEPVPS